MSLCGVKRHPLKDVSFSPHQGTTDKVYGIVQENLCFRAGVWDSLCSVYSMSNGESNVWCKTNGEEEDRGPNGDVRIEGNSDSDGKGEWSEMVRACVAGRDDGHFLRKALEFEVKGKRKRGRPKKT